MLQCRHCLANLKPKQERTNWSLLIKYTQNHGKRQMEFNLNRLIEAISKERLSVYGYQSVDGASGQTIGALAKYLWNVALSEAFYPSIQLCEITLRNQLHTQIAYHLGEPQWLIDSAILKASREGEEVGAVWSSLMKRQRETSYYQIIPELSFGFWTGLLHKRYEGVLWPWLLKPCFPCLAKRNRTQAYIFRRLNEIRQLRNRIFHHEKIAHLTHLPQIHQEILDVIGWMQPAMVPYAQLVDRFLQVYSQGAGYYERQLERTAHNTESR